MNYPFALIRAYLAAVFESFRAILLLLGLGTRYISIPLIIIMLVAIFTVHLENVNAADNGY
jgi:putative oxidoreductase